MNGSHRRCRNAELTRQQFCRKDRLIFVHCVNESQRCQVAVKNDEQGIVTSKTHKRVSLLCPALQRPQLDAWVQFWI